MRRDAAIRDHVKRVQNFYPLLPFYCNIFLPYLRDHLISMPSTSIACSEISCYIFRFFQFAPAHIHSRTGLGSFIHRFIHIHTHTDTHTYARTYTYQVSKLLNFFVTTLPRSIPSRSTMRDARSGWDEPENTLMLGILDCSNW